MTTLNSYATLAEYKAFVTARGQTFTTDATDDAVIENLLLTASNYIDGETQRHFTPYVETRYYDVPTTEQIDPRALRVDDDLLEIISLTNGDGTSISSSSYDLLPRNQSPYNVIRLKDNATAIWASDGAGNVHSVIAITAIWGFHNRYSQAWLLGSTANEAMDTSETGFDVTSGTPFAIGNLIRFDNEFGYVSAVASNTLTTTRGENYSTATTHLTAINVYIWQPMREARTAVCEIAQNAYRRRFGQASTSANATVTAAGVVLSPRDVPAMAQKFMERYRKYL